MQKLVECVPNISEGRDQAVIDAHIDLYVNDYSIDLGETGRSALLELFRRAADIGAVESLREDIFL